MEVSPIRFSGMASGLDTENIIKELMQVEQIPLDKLSQQQQLLEWQQEAYREANTKLLSLREASEELRLQSSFQGKTATGGSDAYTVAPKNSAVDGSFTFEVTQLAASATLVGNSTELTQSSTLPTNGETLTTLTVNDTVIEFDAGVTVRQLIQQMNDQSDATGVKATFDEGTGRFFFTSTTTGEASSFDVSGSNSFLRELGLVTDTDGTTTSVSAVGQDAIVRFNETELTYSSNQFTIADMDFQLHSETTSQTSFTIDQDLDGMVELVTNFVDIYNETLVFINGQLTEERYRDYPPLTEAQKEEMSDKQVELWEEKAQSGILKGDRILTGILFDLRSSLGSAVEGLGEGEVNTLSQIGITTGDWQERGKLHLDEAKLQEVLSSDPDAVMNLFTAKTDESNPQTWGIGHRLYTEINQGMDQLSTKAGSTSSFSMVDNSSIGKEMRQVNDRMSEMERRLSQVESRYWNQFTAMEQALHQMNAQGDWLMQQLGSMQ